MIELRSVRAIAAEGPGFVVQTKVVSKEGVERWDGAGFFLRPEQAILELSTHCKKPANRDVLVAICDKITSVKNDFKAVSFESFLFESFRLRRADTTLFVIERLDVAKSGKEAGKETVKSLGWYNNVPIALGRMLDMVLHSSQITTLGELRSRINAFAASVEAAGAK
ncbi:MAG: hypothetical protein WC565_03995 [Parcubacteria group bacterium]